MTHVSLANPGNSASQEGSAVSLQLAGDDPGGTLTYTATGLPNGVSLGSSSGLISATIAANTHGSSPYTVTVTATDGSYQASQTFVWTVTPHVVIINPGVQYNADCDTVSLPITATDTDNGTLSYSATGLPSGLSINSSTGLISGTLSSTADANSPYMATDGSYSDSQTFAWNVSHIFLVNPGTQSNYDGDTVSLALNGRDNLHDTLTFSATGLPTGLNLNTSTGLISGTLASTDDAGSPYYGAATVSNGTYSYSRMFTWSVNQEIIFADPGTQTNADGDTVSLQITAADLDNGTLTYSASGLPSGLTVNSSSGVISGTIATNADANSPYTATVTATDWSYSASDTFTWNVNYLGLANPGPQVGYDGKSVSFTVAGDDHHGDTLTYSATGLPSGLTIPPVASVPASIGRTARSPQAEQLLAGPAFSPCSAATITAAGGITVRI